MRLVKETEMQTLSGDYFDLADPHHSPINIMDIAGSLSKQCRFTGHTKDLYTVAQHSVHVSHLVETETGSTALALIALLHDAHEAYTGDISTPMKSVLGRKKVSQIENNITDAIMREFGIDTWADEMYKLADLIALATERRDQLREQERCWPCLTGIAPDSPRIVVWSPDAACVFFINRFEDLI